MNLSTIGDIVANANFAGGCVGFGVWESTRVYRKLVRSNPREPIFPAGHLVAYMITLLFLTIICGALSYLIEPSSVFGSVFIGYSVPTVFNYTWPAVTGPTGKTMSGEVNEIALGRSGWLSKVGAVVVYHLTS